ncbi:nuclear transport factor 2 family protein [[Mycobacterium] wendilense]|uniref:Nuclear transport factor 2 family protein n=1 Tax=[Mycobacterium] wendilense TaxID=3064284 RepID=A0ABN9P439_9MYCO|nr:nuclear transport factor 2 family protein [Mycolicibacterium sp. MU0050]CAJ1586606.1 nuclear transport factor 2 family protein [Mycolicibacterium sp. MU0050]
MTPFDDPQAEQAWMFLQTLSDDGDLDEGFALLSDDFTYWNNAIGRTLTKTELREITERARQQMVLHFDLVRCLNESESVVIEARSEGANPAGDRYDSPVVFIFDMRHGLITSLREYCDTRLFEKVFGANPG